MWPWGHAVVGYLAFAAVTGLRRRRLPTRGEGIAVLFGTQLPDLVDKPLAWSFQVLPSGRSLAHSLVTATVLFAVVLVVARSVDRVDLVGPFGLGYLLHLLTDLPSSVLAGDLSGATFLVWPILPPPDYQTEPAFSAHFALLELTPSMIAQLVVFLVVLLLVIANGLAGTRDPAE